MAKKRVRKDGSVAKYRPRIKRAGTSIQTIEDMRLLFLTIETSILIRLPMGECDVDDLCCLRDFVNLTQLAYMTRKDHTVEEINEASDYLSTIGHSLVNVINRYKKIKRVVCTGDELATLRDGLDQMSPYIHDLIENSPDDLICTWMLMHKYNAGSKDYIQVHPLDPKKVERDLAKIKANRAFLDHGRFQVQFGA